MLFNNNKEIIDSCYSVKEPENHYTKWKKANMLYKTTLNDSI
jgi:hypothetical protein